LTRLLADGKGFVRPDVFGDDGRLAQNDAFALDVDQYVGGA
jgi:hypothetical protein